MLTPEVKRLGALPLAYVPGTRWNYSVATDVLGHVIERISGRPLDARFSPDGRWVVFTSDRDGVYNLFALDRATVYDLIASQIAEMFAGYEADLGGLADEETLLLHGAEDVSVLPAIPAALNRPRRGFATRNWRLD